ncbi:hypothetical protein [Alkalimonas amylolytica]|uniref:Uncharacterized protein n=1 Tax=Alkalimonas amylolytica TaxID=152573 RepID=A0A1H3ZNE8_ALKAM|nr:hypothetical protein [Alkalimonas amylolytica]SEA24762.1 hypothetical protein SAMN04488051_102252 [Alkalimonas amylolytica]
MDYSRYTIQELHESLSSIDKDAYPDRYQKLINEFESRKEEIEQHRKEEDEKFYVTVNSRLNILAWLQIATCLGFIYVGVVSLLEHFTLFILALFLGISVFNGFAGFLLLKRIKLGFHLSFFNQVAQLFAFNLGFIYYSYSGLGGVMVILQNGIAFKASILNPSFQFFWGNNLGFGVGLDLVALFFIYLLNTCRYENKIWQ